MKAVRLRVATGMLALLALVLCSMGAAHADPDELKSALEDYAAGRYEQALGKLQNYVKSNPEDAEVLALIRDADNRVLLRAMAQGGEHERLINYLIDKAKPAAKTELSDADAIQALVKQAVEDDALDRRRSAQVQLRPAGALAVPYLYPYFESEDAGTIVNAMRTLHQLGGDATLALAETLSSDNSRVRFYAAATLGHIGDPRGLPALSRAAENDEDAGVKEKAAGAVANIGGPTMRAADAYVALGRRFYSNDVSVVATFDDSQNIWRWEDGALASYSAPSYLYRYLMAEECAADALDLDAGNGAARALLVSSLLAQKVESDVITANGGSAPEALAGAFNLAKSQGFQAASDALANCLERRDWDVAAAACQLVAATYGDEELGDHPIGSALVAPQKRVRYMAAIAVLHMSPKAGVANSDKVAALAAQAASESAIRQVLVIDDDDETRSQLLMALAHSGYVAAGEASGTEGVMRAKGAPTLDVIVVRADLGDQDNTIPAERHLSSLMVIDELLADARTRDMRIVVLLQDTAESKKDAVQSLFADKYGDKVAGFIEVPIVEADAMSKISTAAEAGDLNPDRERANALAAMAADAFAQTDFSCRSFDLNVAIEPLSTAATSAPTPEIRINATRALGNIRVGGADALVKVLTEGEGDDIRAAAATALGNVLSAMDGTPEQVDALIAAANGDGAVAAAALAALGSVSNLTPEQRRAIFHAHRLQVPSKN